ncbi:MAG TPA: hypothetical protein VMS64_36935 [Candidatus Methylomirabilis sp.]|nr:hypothetical protein [Candidatus Methylomirabilis sp.]
MRTLAIALTVVGLLAGPALANQCPLLIKQVRDACAGKTDDACKKALALADDAEKLHKEGKHAESVAKAQEAAKPINLTLKMKQ